MLTDKTALAALRYLVGQAGDYSASPGARYLRLWTTLPGADGAGGVEVSGGSYAALSIVADFPTVSTGARSVANDSELTFAEATADWGTVAGFTISTSSTGTTTFIGILPMTSPVLVEDGDLLEFAVGALVLSVA